MNKKSHTHKLFRPVVRDVGSVAGLSNNFAISLIALTMFIAGLYAGYTFNRSATPIDTSSDDVAMIDHHDDAKVLLSQWRTFSIESFGMTFKYPSKWISEEEEVISEKEYEPGMEKPTDVYNKIEISRLESPLSPGKTNVQWFNSMNTLAVPVISNGGKMTALALGHVRSGEKYVLLRNEKASGTTIEGYVLKGETLYQITLSYFDDNGLATIQEILPSVVFK